MRPRTPSIIYVPFLFSVTTISWALLVGALAVLAAVLLTPAVQDLRTAEAQRNDLQATVDLLDKKIALQQEFIPLASHDPLLMQRLASRQLHLERKDQVVLVLDPDAAHRDRSVSSLISESLTPVTPVAVAPLPAYVAWATSPTYRPLLLIAACLALALSFVLSLRYRPRPAMV